MGFFACKGYPSHSALWQWLQGVESALEASLLDVEDDEGRVETPERIEEAVVLYFGDHDPDGWQIPRSAEEALNTFVDVQGIEVPPIRFIRCALNRDQIRQHNPPPFPAKQSSSRFAGLRLHPCHAQQPGCPLKRRRTKIYPGISSPGHVPKVSPKASPEANVWDLGDYKFHPPPTPAPWPKPKGDDALS